MTDTTTSIRTRLPKAVRDALDRNARIHGQLDNATWFARRIGEYRAAGEHALAEDAIRAARENGIELAPEVIGEPVAKAVEPTYREGCLIRRQAGGAP